MLAKHYVLVVCLLRSDYMIPSLLPVGIFLGVYALFRVALICIFLYLIVLRQKML